MLEGIRALGSAVLERTPSLVEALVDTQILEGGQGGRNKGLIVTLEVQLDPPRLKLDSQDLDEDALIEVRWIGNVMTSASPPDRLTTDRPEYLASQTVPNLLKGLPEECDLARKLQRLLGEAFLDLGEKKELFSGGGGDAQYERYRRLWDLRKLGLDGDLLNFRSKKEREEVERICEQEGVEFLSRAFLQAYARKKKKAAEAVKLVGKVLKDWVAQQLDVKRSQIKLYTLSLAGERLVQHPDYTSYIERRLVTEVFEGADEGTCHVCGFQKRVTANVKRFELLKFYINDKPGFASGLHPKGFLRNYTLCEGCYRALLAGERFVENGLRTRLGRSDVYLIPVFHLPEARPAPERLKAWADYLKRRLKASETLQRWQEFQWRLEQYRRYEERKALFVLNFLFANRVQSAVKVEKLIAEVPPSRLDRLDKVRNTVREWAGELLGMDERGEWDLGLEKLFYLLPLRQRDQRAEAKPYLELLDALLVGRPLSARALIPQLLETALIHRFERYEAHVHKRPEPRGKEPPQETIDRALVLHLLQAQLFLRYLKELDQLNDLEEGGPTMVEPVAKIEQGMLDEDLRNWMDGLGLNGAQRGLFLLGVLIGRIGSTPEQRQSGKPILNKVHFQGMDQGKIMRLANEVYEKLRQYKIVKSNEGLYAVMKAHLDLALNELGSPQENVFWVLSGYAYATWQAIRAGKLKRQAEAKVEIEPEGEEVPE